MTWGCARGDTGKLKRLARGSVYLPIVVDASLLLVLAWAYVPKWNHTSGSLPDKAETFTGFLSPLIRRYDC